MNTTDPRLHRIRCSAKSLGQTRNSCAHKELQFHGVEDGFEGPRNERWRPVLVGRVYCCLSEVDSFRAASRARGK